MKQKNSQPVIWSPKNHSFGSHYCELKSILVSDRHSGLGNRKNILSK